MTETRLNPKRVHLSIFVDGRVQGVAFRAAAAQLAAELSLDGTVRNLDDGRVHMIVEGDYDQVQLLINWCHEGPRFAEVNTVTTSDGPLEGLAGFHIV